MAVFFPELKDKEHYEWKNNTLAVVSHAGCWGRLRYAVWKKTGQCQSTREQITQWSNSLDKDVKNIFFNTLAKLDAALFDRTKISKDIKAILLNQSDGEYSDILLAEKLNCALERVEKGNSGVYFVKNIEGETRYIFKPYTECSLISDSWGAKLRSRLWQCFYGIDTAKPFQNVKDSEEKAYILATSLGYEHLVPKTRTIILNGQKGSLQTFVKSAVDFQKAAGLSSWFLQLQLWWRGEKVLGIPEEQFQQMAILDFLLCNRDRHFENILVKENNIYLIDNQLSLPIYNPYKNDISYRRHQYKWALLPQAKKVHLTSLPSLDVDSLDLQDQQKTALAYRYTVLQKVVEQYKTVDFLAKLKSAEEMQAFLLPCPSKKRQSAERKA